MDKPNFYRAKLKAYETLIKQKSFSFPIDPRKLKLDFYNILIISLQEYSQITNISMEQLTSNSSFNDGYTYFKNNTAYIFYNDDIETEGRKLWTISHEIGHIVLDHTEDSELAEKEVKFFAKYALVPPVLVHKLKLTTPEEISETFDVSYEAAYYALVYYNKWLRYSGKYYKPYEEQLLVLFSNSKLKFELN